MRLGYIVCALVNLWRYVRLGSIVCALVNLWRCVRLGATCCVFISFFKNRASDPYLGTYVTTCVTFAWRSQCQTLGNLPGTPPPPPPFRYVQSLQKPTTYRQQTVAKIVFQTTFVNISWAKSRHTILTPAPPPRGKFLRNTHKSVSPPLPYLFSQIHLLSFTQAIWTTHRVI